MIDLYLSKKIYDYILKNQNKLWYLICNRSVKVFLDDVPPISNSADRGPDMSNDLPSPLDGKDMISFVKKIDPNNGNNGQDDNDQNDRQGSLSKAIFILDGIGKDKAKTIQNRLGIICLAVDPTDQKYKGVKNDIDTLLTKPIKRLTIEKDQPNSNGWEYLFHSDSQTIPNNAIILSDRYIWDGNNINIKEIVKAVCKMCSNVECDLELLILSGKPRDVSITREAFQEKIEQNNAKLKEIAKSYKRNIIVEYIYVKKSAYNYECRPRVDYTREDRCYYGIHDRLIFSNYFSVFASQGLNAFNDRGPTNYIQTLEYWPLFPFGLDDSEHNTEKQQDIYIKKWDITNWADLDPDHNSQVMFYYAYKIPKDGESEPQSIENYSSIRNKLIRG